MFDLLQTLLGKTITLSATSVFFLISGFLFFYHVDRIDNELIKGKIRKRFHSLLIPYLLWNLLAVSTILGVKYLTGTLLSEDVSVKNCIEYFWCNNQWFTDRTNILGWSAMMTGPADLPLWYLRDLIVVTLFSPILYVAIRYLKKCFIAVLSVIYVFNLWIPISGFSVHALMFWSTGAYLSINRKPITCDMKKTPQILLYGATFILMMVVTWLKYANQYIVLSDILHRIVTLGLIVIYLNTFTILVQKKQNVAIPAVLVSSAFFVYAVHDFPVIGPIHIISRLQCFWPAKESIEALIYLIIPFIVYAVSVVIYALMLRVVPRLAILLSGGRK